MGFTSEGEDLGRVGAIFLFVNPGAEVRLSRIADAITYMNANQLPVTVEDWAKLMPLTIAFAKPGEATAA
jgi:hypothetical protein